MNTTIVKYSLKRENWIIWIKNITIHNYVIELYKPNMTTLQSLGKPGLKKDMLPDLHVFINLSLDYY